MSWKWAHLGVDNEPIFVNSDEMRAGWASARSAGATDDRTSPGIKIVDLSVAISGPLAVGILADQGAEVIKIEQPGIGDIARFVGVAAQRHLGDVPDRQPGKRSVVLDLPTHAASRCCATCAATRTSSCRTSVRASPSGWASATTICAPPCDIIYVSISGFGDTGPLAHKRVYDNVVQAQSG